MSAFTDPLPAPRSRWRLGIAGMVCVLLLMMAGSLLVGPTAVTWSNLQSAFTRYDQANDAHFAVLHIRLPRTILAAVIGASLATSGALMQGVTRNDLAGPTIMGLSSGGAFSLLLAVLLIPHLSLNTAVCYSFAGAGIGYFCVWAVAFLARGGLTPVRLALAGTVVSVLLGTITQGLTIYFSLHDEMLYWTLGGIANVSWSGVLTAVVPAIPAIACALMLAPAITILSLGEDIASGLGQRVRFIRVGATLCVLLLTGSAIAVAGPVGFVGVITPHVARRMIGFDYRRVLPFSALLGATFTVAADIGSRTLGGGQEVPLGLFTSMVGAACFIGLARRRTTR